MLVPLWIVKRALPNEIRVSDLFQNIIDREVAVFKAFLDKIYHLLCFQ